MSTIPISTNALEGILTAAKRLEGKSRARCLTASDVCRLYAACAAYDGEIKSARAYAGNGAFVLNSYKWRAEITYVAAGMWGIPHVGRTGAHRSYGNGAGTTINGRAV